NVHIPNTGGKFRFSTLQSRYQTFIDLWDRGLKAREEGRPGPFANLKPPADEKPKRPLDRIVHVTTFSAPIREMDKLQDLYESLDEARRRRERRAGHDVVLGFGDVPRLRTLRAVDNLEFDRLTLFQGPEAVATDCGIVHENVAATLPFNETVALGVVEPLDLTCDTH